MTRPPASSQAGVAADVEGHPPGHVPHVPAGSYELGYVVLAAVFVAVLMLTNVIGTKLFALPLDIPVVGVVLRAVDRFIQWLVPGQGGGDSLTLTAGIVTYPLTFLITDMVSETYGRKRADLMVIMGFVASLFMLLVLALGKALPPSDFWTVAGPAAELFRPDLVQVGEDGAPFANSVAAQGAYAFTFDAPGVLLLASMTAYLCAQLVDNRLFHFWRRLTRGRALWFRNNASTAISQLVDTIIVNTIFLHFYFGFTADFIVAVIISNYVVKFLLAMIDTPFCYAGVYLLQRLVRSPLGTKY